MQIARILRLSPSSVWKSSGLTSVKGLLEVPVALEAPRDLVPTQSGRTSRGPRPLDSLTGNVRSLGVPKTRTLFPARERTIVNLLRSNAAWLWIWAVLAGDQPRRGLTISMLPAQFSPKVVVGAHTLLHLQLLNVWLKSRSGNSGRSGVCTPSRKGQCWEVRRGRQLVGGERWERCL